MSRGLDSQSLIQSLEEERDQYLKDFGSNRFIFVYEIAERVVEQNNQLISNGMALPQKLELPAGGGVKFFLKSTRAHIWQPANNTKLAEFSCVLHRQSISYQQKWHV